jgi:transposase InsO family protein
MCRVLKVAPSGYYAWVKRPQSQRARQDECLKVHIRAAHKRSRKTYGSPRILRDLKADGLKIARKRIARLMRDDGLCGVLPKKFKRTTDSKHTKPVADNILDRKFDEVTKPNEVWSADITYLWTAQGWLYLAVVIDIFSRRVVGFKIDDHMRAELVVDAYKDAVSQRDIEIGTLMHHSDRGSQYASEEYREELKRHEVLLSMSRKGNCWDNSVSESFFATLKKELIYRQYWLSRSQITAAITDYIKSFYNRERRHSSIGFMSPADYERLTMLAKAA